MDLIIGTFYWKGWLDFSFVLKNKHYILLDPPTKHSFPFNIHITFSFLFVPIILLERWTGLFFCFIIFYNRLVGLFIGNKNKTFYWVGLSYGLLDWTFLLIGKMDRTFYWNVFIVLEMDGWTFLCFEKKVSPISLFLFLNPNQNIDLKIKTNHFFRKKKGSNLSIGPFLLLDH